MSKTIRLLRLVALLSNRRSVSFKTMQQVAEVPERTLYRYLTHLSEANVPVFYDRQTRGYRLAGAVGHASEALNFNDLILTTVALSVFRKQVNQPYGELVDDLIRKITANSSLPLEEVLQTIDSSAVQNTSDIDFSEILSRVIVSAAISCNRSLVATRYSKASMPDKVVIPKATISYDTEWLLNDLEKPHEEALHLSQLAKVVVE